MLVVEGLRSLVTAVGAARYSWLRDLGYGESGGIRGDVSKFANFTGEDSGEVPVFRNLPLWLALLLCPLVLGK